MAALFGLQEGYRQLSTMLEAKASKLKSLRKESDKAEIILLSFFHLVRDQIPLCTRGKEGVWSEAEVLRSPSGTERHRSEHVGHSVWKLGNAPPKPRENDESLMKLSQTRK